MPAGVGYSKKDLTGVRAKLEALHRRKKKTHQGKPYQDMGKGGKVKTSQK